MGRKKIDGGVDNRNRQSIVATINLDSREGQQIDKCHKAIKAGNDGMKSWKQFVTNALSLYIDLRDGHVEVLRDLFPRVVDAVRLFLAIESGDLSVMRELFPNRYELFRLQLEADILETINQDTQKDLLKELRTIKAEIANLKATGIQAAPDAGGGPKQIAGIKPIAAPTFDDEADEDLFGVRKDENAGQRASNNFLASIARLQT